MPATAGRVRMPANNRIHSSSALQTHGIWQSTIGDPYKPKSDLSDSKPDAENSYANYQGLLQLARLTKPYADEVRGACTRCGRVGHLTYQCRNYLRVSDKEKEDQPEANQADVASKLKGKLGIAKAEDVVKNDISEEEKDEDSDESSDSDYDSDMERLIAQRHGKISVQREKLKRKKKKNKDSNVEVSDTDSGGRKKKGRSKKRRSRKRKLDDSDDSGDEKKKRRKEKRRKRVESSDEDGKRRRRHRKSRK